VCKYYEHDMSYSDSEGHIDSDEYYCEDCSIRFRTYNRLLRHLENACPNCELHTRGQDDDSHECKGKWGWQALIQFGDGREPVRRFFVGMDESQLFMWLLNLKNSGYANIECKRWWGQEFDNIDESDQEYLSVDSIKLPDC
jgi:hypothetical protein